MKAKMKAVLMTATMALVSACANQDAGYWSARESAIGSLPKEQQAAARIELLRDEHAQTELERQRIADIVNSSIH